MYRRGAQACPSLVRPGARIGYARYHTPSSGDRPKHSGPTRQRPAPNKDALFKKVDHLVDLAAREPTNFEQKTKVSVAERSRQVNLAASSKGKKVPPSLEKMSFDREKAKEKEITSAPNEDNEAPDVVFEPGTFVEIRKPATEALGIILGHRFVDRTMYYSTLVVNGEVWTHAKDDVTFDVPSFLPNDLATRCGMEPMPSNQNEHAARVAALKHLREFNKEIHDVRNSTAMGTQDLYDSLRSRDPKASATTTVSEVARLLCKQPTMATLFAAHYYMMSDCTHFEAAADYQHSHTFTLRPFERVERIRKILGWVKQVDGPIAVFAGKATQIRDANRRLYEETRHKEPQSSPGKHIWNENDKVIISFLLDNLRTPIGNQQDPYVIGTSNIVQKVAKDVEEVTEEDTHRLLVDIGVLAPWSDIFPLRYDLELDLEGRNEVKGEEVVKKASSSRPCPSDPMGPEDFLPSDPLESLRHDFGDLPVYVIDDASASELDDGVSVESVPSEPGSYWVHVHVADPTSILPPTHIFSRHAERQNDTFYLYHTTYPMLPRALTHHPQHGLSLGSLENPIQRTLTFSTKINAHGDIVDYQVRPGIIRNLVIRSYATVNRALGWQSPKFNYPFDEKEPSLSPSPSQPFSEADIQVMRHLKRVAQYSIDRRMRDNKFHHSHLQAEIFDTRWPPNTAHFTLDSMQYSGFPSMKYRTSATKDYDVGAHNVIAECMKLACRTASLFCKDRGVPILRRYATEPIIGSQSAYQNLLDSRTPTGYIDYWQSHGALKLDSIAGYTAEPKGHFGLGVLEGEGYTRVTSPLRRYGDMLAHWQIQSAILGKKPFVTLEWLQDYSIQVRAKERVRVRTCGSSAAYYHVLYLRNWLEERRRGRVPDMLKNLTARTSTWPTLNPDSKKWQAEVEIEALALKALCVGLPSFDTPPGTELRIQIDQTTLGRRPRIFVKPA
ncbi:3'-5' RNA exonuclease complex component [Paramarasmius palmivorus]|uniref:3'-5' RNA exonuclease complex component n=1 Tax=Paramarasmius palmivorus TaxID=297713 RepID=A0AAW0DHA1_9AGAR